MNAPDGSEGTRDALPQASPVPERQATGSVDRKSGRPAISCTESLGLFLGCKDIFALSNNVIRLTRRLNKLISEGDQIRIPTGLGVHNQEGGENLLNKSGVSLQCQHESNGPLTSGVCLKHKIGLGKQSMTEPVPVVDELDKSIIERGINSSTLSHVCEESAEVTSLVGISHRKKTGEVMRLLRGENPSENRVEKVLGGLNSLEGESGSEGRSLLGDSHPVVKEAHIASPNVRDQVSPPAFGTTSCDSRNRDESPEGTGINCIALLGLFVVPYWVAVTVAVAMVLAWFLLCPWRNAKTLEAELARSRRLTWIAEGVALAVIVLQIAVWFGWVVVERSPQEERLT